MKQMDASLFLFLFTLLGVALAQPGIARSDGTFSLNTFANSSSTLIVPQTLILAKTGTTAVDVMSSLTTYNTKLRVAEHLKLFDWEETRYDVTTTMNCTTSIAATVSTNTTYLVFADSKNYVDVVFTFNQTSGKISYLQQLDPSTLPNMKTQKLSYFSYNNSHFISRSNLEGKLGNPSKLFKLNSSNLWTEYQQINKQNINQVADIEYCYPVGAPDPVLLISYSGGLNLQKANSSGYFYSATNISTSNHGDSLCLSGNGATYLAALDITNARLSTYTYDTAQSAFNSPLNVSLTGWVAGYGTMAAIKYTDPSPVVGDIFYVTICQQGTGPSYVVKYAPNLGTYAVLGTLPTPATSCTDVDTFTIDSTNYMTVSSGTQALSDYATQALYRWNQAVEEWDLISTVNVQQGISSHSVFKDKNSLTWAVACLNPYYAAVGSYTYKFF